MVADSRPAQDDDDNNNNNNNNNNNGTGYRNDTVVITP